MAMNASVQVAATSLYHRVHEQLFGQIDRGELAPGAALPSEPELCEAFGVSRITIRRALKELADRRLIVRRRGVGTFVANRLPDQREFRLAGYLGERRILQSRIEADNAESALEEVAGALGLEPGAQVRHIRTVAHRDGEPFTVADAYAAEIQGQQLRAADYASPLPIADAFAARLGRRIERAEQRLDADAADAEVARLLGLAPGAPLLRGRLTYFTSGDTPTQYLVVRFHPDKYRFVVDLVPRPGQTAFEATSHATGEDQP